MSHAPPEAGGARQAPEGGSNAVGCRSVVEATGDLLQAAAVLSVGGGGRSGV